MRTLYKNLQKKLDQMATGFPETKSGIELKILRQLFSETEAKIFMGMTPFLETPENAAARMDCDPGELNRTLEKMAKKGLLIRHRKSDQVRYAAVPFVAGIFEFQVDRLTKELSQDIRQYCDEGFSKTIMAYKHPPMRNIPVNKKLISQWPIAPYEDVEAIFDRQEKIVLLNCICRTWGRQVDNDCGKPLETCFYFGSHADYFIENKTGRYVDAEQAKAILKETLSKYGLVLQLAAGKNPGAVCMCCGDCCNMLLSLKKQPVPAKAAKSNYFITAKKQDCVGCAECLERCQMDALQLADGVIAIDYNRCIGCGACTFGCSNDVLALEKKKENELYQPPENLAEAYMDIAVERGIL